MNKGGSRDVVFSLFRAEPQSENNATEGVSPLPLRLAAERGVLGLEVSRPIGIGPICITSLHAELSELKFPIDLSKGVKQFRNRPSVLTRITYKIDTFQIAEQLSQALRNLTGGDGFEVCIRPILQEQKISATSRTGQRSPDADTSDISSESSREDPQQAKGDSQHRINGLSVTIVATEYCLSFDLLIESGRHPRFIIDNARGLGMNQSLTLGRPALGLAMQLVDQLLEDHCLDELGLTRSGRTLNFAAFTSALCLELLPSLGCRLPSIDDLVLVEMTAESAQILVSLEKSGEALVSSKTALLVSGLASLSSRLDDALARGQYSEARQQYLKLLEAAPAHPQLLVELADLDVEEKRPLAAIGFINEALEQTHDIALRCHDRAGLNLYRSLRDSARYEAAIEAARNVLRHEKDPFLRAALLVQVAEMSGDDPERPGVAEALTEAINLAPRYEYARWLQIRNAIKAGELRGLAEKIEQLLSLTSMPRRMVSLLKVTEAMLGQGYRQEAEKYLRVLRRYEPLEFPLNFSLGEALAACGMKREAIESLNYTLRNNPEMDEFLPERQLIVNQGRLAIALLLDEELGDAAQALIHVRQIDSRGLLGFQARQLEIQLETSQKSAGHMTTQARVVSVQLRLLEALEMQWIPLEPAEELLRELVTTPDINSAVRAKAESLLLL